MNTNTRNQQIEFDVFADKKPAYSYLSQIKNESRDESAPVNLIVSQQSIVIIFICVVMSLVGTFTLGVEKGKLVAKNNLLAQNEVSKKDLTGAPPAVAQTKPNTDIAAPSAAADATIEASLVPEEVRGSASEALPNAAYTIQVASLKTEKSAKNLSELLSKTGLEAFTKPSGNYIIVLAGNFSKKEEAQAQLKELKKTYNDCFIKKI